MMCRLKTVYKISNVTKYTTKQTTKNRQLKISVAAGLTGHTAAILNRLPLYTKLFFSFRYIIIYITGTILA